MGFNKGQLYERKLFKELKDAGKIPSKINNIEQIPGQDITVENRFGTSGLEIKLNLSAAFGSGTLKFDNSPNKLPWVLTESSELDDENTSKEIMRSIARKYKLTDKVNKKWYLDNDKYYPLYLEEEKINPFKNVIKIPRDKRGKQDLEALSEIKIRCSYSDIADYYTSKGSYYIQIGGKGLYWFGGEDPLNISNNLKLFAPSETFIRVRVQPKGSGKYNFSYGLYAKGLSASNEDLDRNLNVI
jgi:hypothetical protein